MALSANTTQKFVPIQEIRNGIIVLKNGGMRALLMASSINLSLKSSEEQKAIILQFQNFLNSLDFSTQIVVQSRKLDIRPYLIKLENQMKEQTEPLLKIQTREYIQFIRNFTEEVDIMNKNFYIVVPYSSDSLGSNKELSKLFSKASGSKQAVETANFEEKRSQLEQRIGVIQQGLARLGVQATQLGTAEMVELFYKTFNPGETTQSIKIQ